MSSSEIQALQNRVTKLELVLNDVLGAMKSFITRTQVNQILVLNQADFEAINLKLDSLVERVESIEQEPIS